jgi:hypothetical protein
MAGRARLLRFLSSSLLLASAACLRSLPDIPADPNGVVVAGRVVERDIASGVYVPVPGVGVAVAGLGLAGRADAEGRFELSGLPLGPLRLVLTRASGGREPLTVKVVGGLFGRVDGERLFVGDVDLRDPGALRGTVALADAPTPSLAEGTLVAVAETAFRAIVDESGGYTLARLPEGGTFDVVAFRSGYAPARLRGVSVLANTALELAPLVLTAAGSETSREVRGGARWRDAARDPSGITVTCLSETSSTAPAATARTDGSGTYALTLSFGLYRCELDHPEARLVRLSGVAVLPEGVIGLPEVLLTPRGDPATADLDLDGLADAVDGDLDGDGLSNMADVAPSDPEQGVDTDRDGTGDGLDLDDDDDTLSDAEEVSRGRDGVLTDPLRSDSDGDGAPDDRDVCPATPDPLQADEDGDGVGDACAPVVEEPVVPVPLVVRGVVPGRGGAGVMVAVKGSGFDRIARSNVVTFTGDVLAQGLVVSADRLSVVVPAGALTGPISVYNGRDVVTSTGAFDIVPPPIVTSFVPVRAAVGQRVVVSGRGLSGARLFVGNTEAVVLTSAETSLEFVVPAVSAIDWTLEVRGEGGTARPALALTVLGDTRISALVPQVAGRGQLLRILGVGFLGSPGEVVEVEFVGAAARAAPTLVASDELRVVIPDDAQTGPVTVHRGATRVVSGAALSIDGNLATIRAIDPWLVEPGETVTLSGDNFDRVTRVRVAGFEVPHQRLSSTTLTFVLPQSGVPAGRVTVESTDTNNRVVTSTAPEGLNVFRLVNRRVLPAQRTFNALVVDPTRDVVYAGMEAPVRGGVTIDLPSLVATSSSSVGARSVSGIQDISPDGRYVAAVFNNTLALWSTQTWTALTCVLPRLYWVRFSPDSRTLFVGADGLVAVDLTQASPTCQTVGALGGDRTGALHTDTTRRLLVPLGRDFVTIDADPTSPTYGREIDTRWRSPASFATPSVSWSPARRGELSGELPGSRFWTNDSNGLFELRANSDDLPRPMAFAGSAIFAPYWPTLNRRWLVGYASPGGNYMVAISDLASGRARSFAPATGLIRYGAGGPQDWVVVAGPYGGNPELRAYRIETAPVE